MAELTVWTFPTPDAAAMVAARLRNLCARNLIRLDDGAIDGMRFTLVQAPLSAVQEQRLRSTFNAFAD